MCSQKDISIKSLRKVKVNNVIKYDTDVFIYLWLISLWYT